MSASPKHLEHLATILNENANRLQYRPLSENDLREFSDAIALDRVQLWKSDWQGHCVSTLIGHLPNLKPAVKASLYRFVVGRWNAQTDSHPATANLHGSDRSGPSSPHAGDESLTASLLEKDRGMLPQQPFVFPAMPAPRRDWFDRFTDWVAALVSLLK